MPYDPNLIPQSPLPISMLPDAETLTDNDLLLVTQPSNAQGRSRRLPLSTLFQSQPFVSGTRAVSNVIDSGLIQYGSTISMSTGIPKKLCEIRLPDNASGDFLVEAFIQFQVGTNYGVSSGGAGRWRGFRFILNDNLTDVDSYGYIQQVTHTKDDEEGVPPGSLDTSYGVEYTDYDWTYQGHVISTSPLRSTTVAAARKQVLYVGKTSGANYPGGPVTLKGLEFRVRLIPVSLNSEILTLF